MHQTTIQWKMQPNSKKWEKTYIHQTYIFHTAQFNNVA